MGVTVHHACTVTPACSCCVRSRDGEHATTRRALRATFRKTCPGPAQSLPLSLRPVQQLHHDAGVRSWHHRCDLAAAVRYLGATLEFLEILGRSSAGTL